MLGFGTLGKMFGSVTALDTVVGGVRSALDSLVHTEEEKADEAAKDRSEARAMVIEWMRATTGQNITRRFLACVVTGTWLLMYMLAAGMSLAAIWLPDAVDVLAQSASLMGGYAQEMNGAMMLILGFYFAAPYMGSIVEGAMKKFGGGK